jgi:predicted anti-sigma-YlaC factor YlaD
VLTCQELTELVTDYLEGRMPLRRRLAFRLHIGMCSRCRTYLKQMNTTIRVLGRFPVDPLPPDVAKAMQHQFRNWKSQDGRRDDVDPNNRPV